VTGNGPWQWNCQGNDNGSLPVSCSAPLFTAAIDSKPPTYSNQATGTITFSSTGAATFQCQLDGGPFLPCSSIYSYTNLTAGSHTVTVRATGSNGSISNASTTFTVVPAAGRTIAPPNLTAGSLPVGSSGAAQTAVLINTGAEPLLINSIPSAAGDFAISHSCPPVLSAGGNCVIIAAFRPTLPGSRNATLTINDSIGTLDLPLAGSGTVAVSGILADSANLQRIVTGIDGAGIYLSSDGGGSWAPATVQPASLRVTAVAARGGEFARIYAATNGGGVQWSTDGGATWNSCADSGLTNRQVLSLTVDAAGKLYAGTEGGVFSSTSDCADWTETNNGLPE
jgi:hypothetical protein